MKLDDNKVLNQGEIDRLLFDIKMNKFLETYGEAGRIVLVTALERGKQSGITRQQLEDVINKFEELHMQHQEKDKDIDIDR